MRKKTDDRNFTIIPDGGQKLFKKIIKCQGCGKKITVKSGWTRYCDECSQEFATKLDIKQQKNRCPKCKKNECIIVMKKHCNCCGYERKIGADTFD